MVRLLVLDGFNGRRGDFYKNMFATCQADRPGTADEAANVPELLMAGRGAFITGAAFLVYGGATAAYFKYSRKNSSILSNGILSKLS